MSATLGAVSSALGQVNAAGQAILSLLDPSYAQATLRGLPFWVPTGNSKGGRRWVTHEFPARDEPWHEDLGQAVRGFDVEGVLIGDDVQLQAEEFQEAIDAPGFARLTHPWWGEVDVAVLEGRVSRSAEERRVARVSLRLEKAGRRPAPEVAEDGLAGVLARINRLRLAVARALSRLRQLLALPRLLLGAFRTFVAGVVDGFTSLFSGFGAPLPSLFPRLRVMDDATLSRPDAFAPLLFDGYREVSGLAVPLPPPVWPAVDPGRAAVLRDPAAVLDALLALTPPPLPPLAAALSPWAASAQAGAAMEAARVLAAMSFADRPAAVAARDRVAEALANAAEALSLAGLDDARVAALDLRAAAVADTSRRAARLPALRRVTLPATLPAALVAFRLDGDALATVFDRADALVRRNRVRHPLFVPGGRPLEVVR